MVYQIKNGSISISGNVILENIDLKIKNTEKIGLVGRNGCGKTTLLKAIVGEYPIEDGYEEVEVYCPKDFKIGYVEQNMKKIEQIKMIDYIRSAYSEILKVLHQIDEVEKRMIKEYREEDFNLYNDLYERFSHCLDAKVESYRILPCKDNWYHDNYCLVILKDFYEEDLFVKDE